jgi:acyl carrier protein
MQPVSPHTRDQVVSVVIDTLAAVSPDVGAASADTHLMGNQAVLDSVGFVTLLVSLEQNLGGAVDLAAAFIEQGDAADKDHPFRTVGTLADHIHRQMAAQAAR